TFKTAGKEALTATDTAQSPITNTQSAIPVVAAAASNLRVDNLPASATAAAAVSFSVTALDPYGNIATSYTGTLHDTSTDTQAVLPADYSFTASDQGQHTFSATLKTAASQSITLTDNANGSLTITSPAISVAPGSVNLFHLQGVPASTPAGTAQSFTVTAFDAYGNVATNYVGTAHFTSSDGQADLPA